MQVGNDTIVCLNVLAKGIAVLEKVQSELGKLTLTSLAP